MRLQHTFMYGFLFPFPIALHRVFGANEHECTDVESGRRHHVHKHGKLTANNVAAAAYVLAGAVSTEYARQKCSDNKYRHSYHRHEQKIHSAKS